MSYYSQKKIQEQIVNASKNKEAVTRYSNSFGKRPSIIQFEGDIFDSVKKGATSFHISEEHWSDPLKLKPGMTKTQLDELRTTYDIILDIDGDFESSRICTNLLIKALEFHNIENIGLKMSGNKGFHICLSNQTLPKTINNIQTNLLFPDAVKITASYLQELIKPHLIKELKTPDPFSKVDIDSILISNRHLYRAPYSLHEKSGLASIPIKKEDILTFQKEQAKPENVKTLIPYYIGEPEEAKQLLIQAFDWYSKQPKEEIQEQRQYEEIKVKINQNNFPPCIQEILKGTKSDGRKRALFILINFFKSTGYLTEDIKAILEKWNKSNYEPLPPSYIQSQLNWHKTKKPIPPPNCKNASYYLDLKICKPENLCKLIKNPVNYAIRKSRFKKQK